MKTQYVMGIDNGGTVTKAAIYNLEGTGRLYCFKYDTNDHSKTFFH